MSKEIKEKDTGMQGKGTASANALSTDWCGVVCITGPVKQSARREGSRSNVEPKVLNLGSEDRISGSINLDGKILF